MNLRIKVCGMRDARNIEAVLALHPDYMGFIFSEKSPRYAGEWLDEVQLKAFPKTTKKVGVFVNANLDLILKNVKKFALDLVQLHGNENPQFCQTLRSKGLSLIKAFAIDSSFNFSRLNNYKLHCDYFLFDTKGEQAGGNGTSFDWNLLSQYDQEKPFFLSGGIGPHLLEEIRQLPSSLNLHALDLNSRFETAPAYKDADLLKSFIAQFRPVMETK